ncbi:MAG: hypothetical protein AAFZ52_00445 [Bacteroidota bacterium]
MPANNRQDWTDDDAFWDDAWEDMAARLEAASPRRRAFAWWTWSQALVLGLVLLVGGVAAWQFVPTGEVEDLPTPSRPMADPIPAEAPLVKRNEVKITKETLAVARPLVTSPVTPDRINVVTSPRMVNTKSLTTNNSSSATTEINVVTSPGTINAQSPAANNSLGATTKIDVVTRPEVLHTQPKAPSLSPEPSREATDAIALLGAQQLLPLAEAAYPLPTPQLIRQRQPGQLRIDLGASAHLDLAKPGYSIGLTYLPASRSKFRFPLGLHLRRDDLRITQIGDNEAILPGAQAPVTDQLSAVYAARQALLADLRTAHFDEVRTLGLEARAGVAFATGKRLSLTGGLGLEYLLQARGPLLTTSDSTAFRNLGGTESFVNLNLGASNEYDLNSVGSGVFTPGNPVPAGGGNVHRLVPRAHFGLHYQLNARLNLEAAGDVLLRPIFQDEAAQLAGTRLRVGLSWQIR